MLVHALFGFGAEGLDVLRSGQERVESVGEGLGIAKTIKIWFTVEGIYRGTAAYH